MPLGRNIAENIQELVNANKSKKKKEKRPMKQIFAIAFSAVGRKK